MGCQQTHDVLWKGLVLCLGWLLLSLATAGCDLNGEYEKQFQQSLQTAGQRAVFDKSLFPTDTEITDAKQKGTGVRLRLPNFFDQQSKSLPPADPRAQPPFIKLPGLSYAIERPDDEKTPVYVYFAAVPKAEVKLDVLQQQIAAALPGSTWSDKQVSSPDGQSKAFKLLRMSGPQDFVKGNQAAKLEGKLDLYLIDGPAHSVLVGWRAAKTSADKLQFDAACDAAMGTVNVTQGGGDGGGAPKAGCF